MLSSKYWRIPYYLGVAHLPTAPLYVNIEPAASCNLRCDLCSSKNRGNKDALMDLSLFEQIIADVKAAKVANVSLWLSGEPLMHPALPVMVAHVEAAGLASGLHTNASLLTERHARELLEVGLRGLSISFDGTNRESYERMRKGARFDKTVANIRRFLELKAARGGSLPHTIIQTIVPFEPAMRRADGWIEYPPMPRPVTELFAGLPVDEYRVLLPHNWAGEVDGPNLRPPGRAYHPCQHLWQGLSIAWDGRVHGCCTDLNGVLIRGDLTRGDTIGGIWNNTQSRRLRSLHRQGRYREIPLCRTCTQVWENEHPLRTELREVGALRPLIAVTRRWRGGALSRDRFSNQSRKRIASGRS